MCLGEILSALTHQQRNPPYPEKTMNIAFLKIKQKVTKFTMEGREVLDNNTDLNKYVYSYFDYP